MSLQVTSYSKCNCGAITIYFQNGSNNSVLEENISKFDVKLPEDEENFRLHDTYSCNHCVNHYGLDICACGSGEKPDECEMSLEVCGKPFETLGESVKFMGWVR